MLKDLTLKHVRLHSSKFHFLFIEISSSYHHFVALMYQVLTYYDIFVRNAFGNYRDILREIAHSPLMGENLSFLQSKSAAYMWENQQVVTFADENFVSCFP